MYYKPRRPLTYITPEKIAYPVSSDGFAVIDAVDLESVKLHNWHINQVNGLQYAVTNIRVNGIRKRLLMHRLIMGATWGDGILVDHRDRNGLNNTRDNLRICTRSQNAANRVLIGKDNTSGYKGVSFYANSRKWAARITVNNGKRLVIGLFDDPAEAARAYDKAARRHFGEFALTNFPATEQA